ncbi:hypothetical protein BD769DRAFT_1487663 [Suillus cothurnatus]|nr:hypothetical protein BD769DRAFT_1487663 [Suillus cothurnatus]
MHRALSVSEILAEIFMNLDQLRSSSGLTHSLTRKSLASLALTCTTFHELAMDLLWANMLGLRPLLGCVARLHPVIYDPKTKYSWSQYADPLAEHEFHQFLRHASRVRNMTIPASRDFRFFLSPTLRHCYISEFHPDLRYIGTRCPTLEEFTIRDIDSANAQLSETIRSCTRLRRLQCPPSLDSAAWMHLSTIPTLLEVKFRTSRNTRYLLNDLDFATFLNLTTLSFRGIEAVAVVAIIQHFNFPSLKEFEMHVHVLHSAEAEQLFRALSQCKASQTLEHIIISSSDGVQGHSSDPSAAVRQFLCFKQLRTLRLCVHHSIFLDNDLLFEAMANLQVSVDVRNIDIEPETESFQHTSLKRLSVDSSDLENVNVEAVARIIFFMLPAVNRIASASHIATPAWNNVNRRLGILRNKLSLAAGRYITGAASDVS